MTTPVDNRLVDRRDDDDERRARAETDARNAAAVERMRTLYASGDRSSAEMLALRSLAQRGGMSRDAIDAAVVTDGDEPDAEATPPAIDLALSGLQRLSSVATDPGLRARSAQSYVDAVAGGHVAYAKMVGLTADDVATFAVTGALPDDARVAAWTTEARRGSWPAANALVLLIDARRSALAAERGALTEALSSAAPSQRASIDAVLELHAAEDRRLVALRHQTQCDVSEADERFAASEVRHAQTVAVSADAAHGRFDDRHADALDAQATAMRDHAAKVAYDEARFRAGSAALGLKQGGLLLTAAQARVDQGDADVAAMHRAHAPTSEAPLALGDAADAGHGVPGAKRLLDEAAAAGEGGHPLPAIENARQRTLAAFHQEHLSRFDPTAGGADTATALHRRAYLEARGAQVTVLAERDRLYAAAIPRAGDELDAVRVRADERDALAELARVATEGDAIAPSLQDARTALDGAKRDEARLTRATAEAGGAADAADARVEDVLAEDRTGTSIRAHEELERATALDRNAWTTERATRLLRDRAADDVRALETRVTALERAQTNVASDAAAARDVLARVVPDATDAVDAARRQADRSAAAERAGLDRLDASPLAPTTRVEVARARTGLASYYVATTASGGAGGLDDARAQIDRADALRRAVPAGGTRDALTVDAIRARSELAVAESSARPDAARRDLEASARTLDELQNRDAAADARVTIGQAATVSVTRAELGVGTRHDGVRYGADEDALYLQAHQMLDRTGDSAARAALGRIDLGLAAVGRVVDASRAQIARGVDVASAQVASTAHDERALGQGAVSGVVDALGVVPRSRVDAPTDDAVRARVGRIETDARGADAQLSTIDDAWRGAERDGHPFEMLDRLRGGVGATLEGDAPLLATLRQPLTALPTVAERYGAPTTATFTSGARDAIRDARESLDRTASTAVPLAYANVVGDAIVGGVAMASTGVTLGGWGNLATGGAMLAAGKVTRDVYGTASREAAAVDLLQSFVPGGGEAGGEKTVRIVATDALRIGGHTLATTVASQAVEGALDVHTEEGEMAVQAALSALAAVGPGALRLARASGERIVAANPGRASTSARIEGALGEFLKKTSVPTGAECEALKTTLYGVTGASSASSRAAIDAEVEALALSRAPTRALAEMGVRPADLTPAQADEAVSRTAALLERARGLSSEAATRAAMRALRPVLVAAGVAPSVLLATEDDAEAAQPKKTPGRVFGLANGERKVARAAVLDLLRLSRARGAAADEIAKTLRITDESATHLASFLRSPEMASLPEIAKALDPKRGASLTAEQSATLACLEHELRSVERLPPPSAPSERAKFAATQRTPSGSHWAVADLSFEDFEASVRARGGRAASLSRDELRAAFDAGKRLDPETGKLRAMHGKTVYATDTDVVLVRDLPPESQRPVDAARDAVVAARRELDAAKGGPDSVVNTLRAKLVDATRRYGEVSADAYAAAWCPGERTLLWPPDDVSRSGDFDRVYRAVGADGKARYLIVEAKGGSADLGDREVAEGRADQGTRRYMDAIVERMSRNPGSEPVAREIELNRDDVTYLEVRAPADDPGTIHAREFDTNVDTGVKTRK